MTPYLGQKFSLSFNQSAMDYCWREPGMDRFLDNTAMMSRLSTLDLTTTRNQKPPVKNKTTWIWDNGEAAVPQQEVEHNQEVILQEAEPIIQVEGEGAAIPDRHEEATIMENPLPQKGDSGISLRPHRNIKPPARYADYQTE